MVSGFSDIEVTSDLFKSIFSGVMGEKSAAREQRRVRGGEVESVDHSFKKLTSLILTACPTSKREIKAEETWPKTKELANWCCQFLEIQDKHVQSPSCSWRPDCLGA